jgi:hemoglobin
MSRRTKTKRNFSGSSSTACSILEEAHRHLKISPEEFDEVAAELGRTLDHVKVPEREKKEVLAAFAAHKGEVTEGYRKA